MRKRTACMYSSSQIKNGLKNPRLAIGHFASKIEPLLPIGTSIYDRDWDVLIVLDACRVDLFEEFAPQHTVFQKFDSTSSIWSVASTTQNWLPRTFNDGPDEPVANTHYVTTTGFAERYLDEERLHDIDHVWKYAKSPEYGYTRIEALTNAGIKAIRESTADRIIIHYAPPHAPFMHCPGKYDSGPDDSGNTQEVWRGLKAGEFDKDEIWQDYGTNLLNVLDEAETVIKNASGKVVITSDHGNGMGEWGVYGHPGSAVTPEVRRVPWATATGENKKTYEIKDRSIIETEQKQTIKENLKALGYRG